MNVAKSSKGNGKADGKSNHPHSIADHSRRIHHDAQALATAVQDATDGVDRYVMQQVHRRPYGTVGVAAGVGYVFGGGISLRLTGILLGAATRLAMALAARELAERFLRHATTASVQHNRFEQRPERRRSDHEN